MPDKCAQQQCADVAELTCDVRYTGSVDAARMPPCQVNSKVSNSATSGREGIWHHANWYAYLRAEPGLASCFLNAAAKLAPDACAGCPLVA